MFLLPQGTKAPPGNGQRRKGQLLLAGREFQSKSHGNWDEYPPFYQAQHAPATFNFFRMR